MDQDHTLLHIAREKGCESSKREISLSARWNFHYKSLHLATSHGVNHSLPRFSRCIPKHYTPTKHTHSSLVLTPVFSSIISKSLCFLQNILKHNCTQISWGELSWLPGMIASNCPYADSVLFTSKSQLMEFLSRSNTPSPLHKPKHLFF